MKLAVLLPLMLLLGCSPSSRQESAVHADETSGLHEPDVRYEPTPQPVVEQMLALARVAPGDVVYDLGSGDGRIPITAARRGARSVGIDIDPALVAKAEANAAAAGVADRVRFRTEDLFTADFSDATVVTLFLYPDLNLRLRPRLLSELKPGTRIVSYYHDMGDWRPDKTVRTPRANIYLWTVPAR